MGLVLVLALCALPISAMCVSTFLGDSVELSVREDCATQTGLRLIHRLAEDQPLTVADRVHGAWTPGETYRDRVESRSASSVLLKRVNYNDGGYYEFMCGGALTQSIQLQALILSNNNLSVSQGDALRLPCYCQTAGRSVESVRWERNGETVLELDASSGEVRFGAGFKGRASLDSDWSSLGDLTLTVEGAQREDRGDYSCSVVTAGRRVGGTPAAVRATIEGPSSPPPPEHVSTDQHYDRAAAGPR